MICSIKRATLKLAALAVVVGLAAVPAAQAQAPVQSQPQPRAGGVFDRADTDHDGHVTLPEYQAYASARVQAANGPRAQKFKQLSPQDQAARFQKRFDRLDKGHKGYLDRTDWPKRS